MKTLVQVRCHLHFHNNEKSERNSRAEGHLLQRYTMLNKYSTSIDIVVERFRLIIRKSFK